MIETQLLNQYGILGLWTAFLIWEKLHFQKEIQKVLKDLTDLIKKKIS